MRRAVGKPGIKGLLTGTDGTVEIRETTRPVPTLIVHKGVVRSGSVREGERLQLSVNRRTRQDAARNHTATHLVHAALRDLLGPHVKQYGSLVAPNRLRFDFAHFRPLASRDIDEIESIVNEQVRYDQTVRTDVMGVQEAVAGGALAFFGDKYGDQVRVVHIDTLQQGIVRRHTLWTDRRDWPVSHRLRSGGGRRRPPHRMSDRQRRIGLGETIGSGRS